MLEETNKNNKIIDGLWVSTINPDEYNKNELYREHVFSQYKICIEMTQKTADRRNAANSFFLTLHSTFFTGLGLAIYYSEQIPNFNQRLVMILPAGITAIILCIVWRQLIISYRQLNTAKFKVIGEYERQLPSSPFWSAEWDALGRGKVSSLYQPLTSIEKTIPIIFTFLYIFGIVGFLVL